MPGSRAAAVITLVGSAGAVKAITGILSALPPEFPAAVLVLIHQVPERAGLLPAVLARSCSLPVDAAAAGHELLPGRVLVAPAGKHLLITGERGVALIASGAYPPSRPSADLLLTTLAISCGADATAVVLSGNGHDGATGATAVHAFGGTVIASDEASSEVFAMPSATIDRDHVIDHVLPLDRIAEFLVDAVAATT